MRSALSLALPGAGFDLTRYILVCGLAIAAVLGAAWLLRRFLADSLRRRAARRSLHVLDVLPLGRRQRLVVVRCFDRSFLIGMGEKELTCIAELDGEEALEPAAEASPATEGGEEREGFAEALAREVVPQRAADPTREVRDLLRGGILG